MSAASRVGASLSSLVGTALATGCSWIFVQPLPEHPSVGDYGACTNSVAAPVVDTVFTLTNVGSAIYVAGQDNVSNKGAAVSLGLAVAAIWFSSAYYGYSKTSECEEAREGPRRPRDPPLAAPLRPVAPRPSVPRPPVPASDAAMPAPEDVDSAVAAPPPPVRATRQLEDSDEPGRKRPRGPPPTAIPR